METGVRRIRHETRCRDDGAGAARLGAGLLLVAVALACATGATAKDFEPGDRRACGATRCVTLTDRALLKALSGLLCGGPRPPAIHSPGLGAPAFELRYRDGYAAGIVASAILDRFLSYGVNLDRFPRGRWYRSEPAPPASSGG